MDVPAAGSLPDRRWPRAAPLCALALVIAAGAAFVVSTDAPVAVWFSGDTTAAAAIRPLNAADQATLSVAARLDQVLRDGLTRIGLTDLAGPGWPLAGMLVLLLTAIVARATGRVLPAVAAGLGLASSGAIWWTAAAQPGAAVAAGTLLAAVAASGRRRAGRGPASLGLAAVAAVTIWFAWPAPAGAAPAAIAFWPAVLGGASMVVSSLGVLGAALTATGVATLAGSRPRLLIVAGGSTLVLFVATAAWGADPATPVAAILPLGWCAAGLGMAWVLTAAATTGARTAAALVVALAPTLNLAAAYDAGAAALASHRAVRRALDRIDAGAAGPPAIVSESPLVDPIVTGLSEAELLPRRRAAIADVLQTGRPVVAFGEARATLAELGVGFAPLRSALEPLDVATLLGRIPDGWIVALATGTEFKRAVTPTTAPTFGAVGGTRSLFAVAESRYGLVGVKGAADPPLEDARRPGERALIRVDAGRPITRLVRAPVSIAVESRDDGGVVRVNGQRVARTDTGIALAVVAPDGRLAGTFAAEYDGGVRLRFSGGLAVSRATGLEPCVAIAAGAWSDASAVFARASGGAILEPGDRLIAYVASEHPLRPRLKRLRQVRAPTLTVETYAGNSDEDRAALEARLAADGLDAPSSLDHAAWIYRLDVTGAPRRRTQAALRLGGFAVAGMATIATAGSRQADLCAASRGRGLLADPETSTARLDLLADDLFVYGWERPERAEGQAFRWSRAPVAELLVPLARAGAWRLVIEGTLADPLASVEVRINGILQSSRPDGAGGLFIWDVPAHVWRVGLNQVQVQVSPLRAADRGDGYDDRLLGLALHGLRLEAPAGADR